MPKKFVVLLTAAALAASLLSGCQWQRSDPPNSGSVQNSSSAASESRHDESLADSAEGSSSDGKLPALADSDLHRRETDSIQESGVSDAASSFSENNAQTACADASEAWMTRLVNAENPLPEDFTVETAAISGYDERLFDRRAAPMLESMLNDAEKAGCKLYLVSAYRSVKRQTALFRRKTNAFLSEGLPQEEAERQAALWVARPGTSEHNTGLAADIVSADWYAHNDDLTADFEKTTEFAWLSAHCAEYGFILRYPQGKEDITGVVYEPWHYRFVGKDAAAFIMHNDLTLEEYHSRM